MKLALAILTFILVTTSLYAEEREIVVLSSLKDEKTEAFTLRRSSAEKIIEKKFRAAFQNSGYKLKIIHKATQEELSFYLQSQKTLSLFWISHAAESTSAASNGQLQFDETILDYYGNNVAPVFQKVGSNLKGLFVIGCSGKMILDNYKKAGYFKNNPELKLFSPEKKISLTKGIKRGLQEASTVLHDFRELKEIPPTDLINKSSVTIQVENVPQDFVAQVTLAGRFIGLITSKNTYLLLDPNLLAGPKIKVMVSIDQRFKSEAPTLDFHSEQISLRSSYFSKPNGGIIGDKKNIYYLHIE